MLICRDINDSAEEATLNPDLQIVEAPTCCCDLRYYVPQHSFL